MSRFRWLGALVLVWKLVLKKDNSEFKPPPPPTRLKPAWHYRPLIVMSYHHHHHHHHVVPLARISRTLSRHFSLSFIASGRSSGLHPVSSHSCCMYVRAGRPNFAWPYAGVHRSTSLMSSSLLLQHCPACLVRLAWIVIVMGGRWPIDLGKDLSPAMDWENETVRKDGYKNERVP